MLERWRREIVDEPWRAAAIVLALGVVGLVVALAMTGGDDPDPVPVSESTTTIAEATTTTSVVETTTTSVAETTTTTTSSVEPPSGEDVGGLIAVKVDNDPQARPPVGLAEAEILVEFPVEGGITRFTAIYPSGLTGFVGPIRSLRPVDADLLPALAGTVVSSGGRPFVVQEVIASGMGTVEAQFSSMFVSLGRSDPYDTFVDLELVTSMVEESMIDEPLFPGAGLPGGSLPGGGVEAAVVEMPFEGVSFEYDDGTGYRRLQDGEPFQVVDLEAETRGDLAHDTLIVLYAAERWAGYVDVNLFPVSTFDVIGSGRLLVFAGGTVIEGSWARAALGDPYVFTTADGAPFGLPEGSIYLAVVPREASVTYE